MNKYLSFFTVMSVLMSMTSCVKSYSIDGSSDISGLDSRMMYLKTVKNNELKDLDSTEVVHGKFGFTGTTDSVRMAYLVVSEAYTLPLVLEDGDINVRINKARTEWGGTPLNDRLYRFMKSLDSLNLQLQDLEHEYNIAFMDGEDMNEVIPRLSRANQLINMSIDTLVTQSIADNFDNILGPGLFMIVTQQQRYPEMSPWVVEIMSKATDAFKNDPYVREYLDNAKYIQNVQNGLEAPPAAAQAANAPAANAPAPAASQPAPTPPTPNEMAAPAKAKAPASPTTDKK
ncbi:MAG: DUF4369 domain-containing protein [Prevotella sp.]|nr:DUF4369 domain-containing protein [Prevotella sp.]